MTDPVSISRYERNAFGELGESWERNSESVSV